MAGVLTFVLAIIMILASAMTSSSARAAGGRYTARGIIKANAEATISVAVSAPVRKIAYRAGESFQKGQTLIEFDCSRYQAEHRAKIAAYEARKQDARNKKRLLVHQAIGASEVAIARAQMDEAKAIADGAAFLVSQCTVKAPYDGRVVERLINEYETPAANQPLIKIIDSSKSRLELIVPSKWLVWLHSGDRFMLTVDETGEKIAATIGRLGAIVDAVSQTVKITAELTGGKSIVLPGMSGTATFAYSGS